MTMRLLSKISLCVAVLAVVGGCNTETVSLNCSDAAGLDICKDAERDALGVGGMSGGPDAQRDTIDMDAQEVDTRPECEASRPCADESKPYCDRGRCAKCTDNSHCADRPGSVCDAMAGRCVACIADSDCPAANAPICEKDACRGCKADTECAGKGGPEICMWHDGGRCATATETVEVEGTKLQEAVTAAVTQKKSLVVVTGNTDRADVSLIGKLSIVGKATMKPAVGGSTTAPGLRIVGGEIYLRNLLITSAAGGILLNATSFEIEDCEVLSNRTGTFLPGPVKWGGIYVRDPGAKRLLRGVKVSKNDTNGILCSAPIILENVMATDNPLGTSNDNDNIAPECKP